jgi:HEAT repeat protein
LRHFIFALSLLLPSLLLPAAASAQLTLEQAIAQLDSSDRGEVQAAIESFGLLGSPAAIRPLATRIRAGLPPDLLSVAVDTLTVLGHRDAGPILFELLSHRRPEIRLLAVQGIQACTPPGADRALVTALSDASPEVRALAATTLGELDARSAVDSLFLAFEHHVTEAGPALARLVDQEGARRLLGYLGSEPFANLRPILFALLTRTDLPSRARLDIVARVSELATAEVRALLEEVVRDGELPTRDPVRRAAEDAAGRIAG